MVAGRDTAAVHFDLVAIEGLLAHVALRCRVPGADVWADGERIGVTPLDKTVTLAPGSHRLEVRRAGYETISRAIVLEDGAQAELTLNPTIDRAALGREGGQLAVRASETQAVMSVDGDEPRLLRGVLNLPRGPHRLRLERGGFLAAERDVAVALGIFSEVDVVFEPTPDTRASYVASAESRRTWSWVTVSGGVAIAASGVVLALVENGKLPSARTELADANADSTRGAGLSCDPAIPHGPDPAAQEAACAARLNDAASKVDQLTTLRTIG